MKVAASSNTGNDTLLLHHSNPGSLPGKVRSVAKRLLDINISTGSSLSGSLMESRVFFANLKIRYFSSWPGCLPVPPLLSLCTVNLMLVFSDENKARVLGCYVLLGSYNDNNLKYFIDPIIGGKVF